MSIETDDHRPLRGLVVLAWTVGNLLIGYFVILPLGLAHTLTYYVRAVRDYDVVAPYGSNGAKYAVFEILVLAGILLTISLFFNRRQWRRFQAARSGPFRHKAVIVTAMVIGAAVLQILPFVLFMTATDRTAPPLFPDSWS